MKKSRSEFIWVRGMRHHLRRWGPTDAPPLILLHGWLDVSASWQFVVDAFEDEWQIIAPDWRGFGFSGWAKEGYWFHDYLADLDAIFRKLDFDEPVPLVGHSLGAQVTSLYSGLVPKRVRCAVCVDGLNVPASPVEVAPKRMRDWLKDVHEPPTHRSYENFEDLAKRIAKHNPNLSSGRAAAIARFWAQRRDDGRVHLLADPRHRVRGPLLYRGPESEAVWKQVKAPVLAITAELSTLARAAGEETMQARYDCFKDLRIETVKGAGHMLHHEAPETTAALIESFLREHG